MNGAAIKSAIVATIAQHASFLPKTTLTADATIGSLTASVVPLLTSFNASRFVPDGAFTFFDGLGEKTLTIRSVSDDGATVVFRQSSGTGFTGLVARHLSGTPVYTNLVAHQPSINAQKMVVHGDPVVFVSLRKAVISTSDIMGGDDSARFIPYTVLVQVDRAVAAPDSTFDQDMWLAQSEDATVANLEEICSLLTANEYLATPWGDAEALTLGTPYGRSQQIVLDWGLRPAETGGGWRYSGTATMTITAEGETP